MPTLIQENNSKYILGEFYVCFYMWTQNHICIYKAGCIIQNARNCQFDIV